MEGEPSLDAACVARISLTLALAGSWAARAETPDIEALFRQGRWREVHRAASAVREPAADVAFWDGVALARLDRWDEAEQRLRAALRLAPRDARFPAELAGLEFRRKRYARAVAWLRRAARLAPEDAYIRNFLGTVYLLLGNLEAALSQWNRVGAPRIGSVDLPSNLSTDPLLLDRAFGFAAGDVLTAARWRTTKARIELLGIFAQPSYRLEARPEGDFDFRVSARERNGWGSTRWEALASLLRGVVYQAIHPGYLNVGGAAMHVEAMLRWDSQKRRALGWVSAPLGSSVRSRWRAGFDLRDERWQVRRLREEFGNLRLDRKSVEAGLSGVGAGWQWSTGADVSHRRYTDVDGAIGREPALVQSGFQLKHTARFTHDLLRVAERRLEGSATVSSETARVWSRPSRLWERLEISSVMRWKPQASGEDYAVEMTARAGRIFGQAPFDELILVGLERDTGLWLRAHPGTRDGRKGSAPLARRYALLNSEMDKEVLRRGYLRVKLSPFFDAGKSGGALNGSRHWLFDTGVQAKIRAPGAGFTFVYGKDLRSGNDIFYVAAQR